MTLVEYLGWAMLLLAVVGLFMILAFGHGAKMAHAKRDAFEAQSARIAQRFEELEQEALLQMRQQDAENRQTDAIEALIAHAAKQARTVSACARAVSSINSHTQCVQEGLNRRLAAQELAIQQLDTLDVKRSVAIDSHDKSLAAHDQCIESHRRRLCHLETEFQRRVGAL